MEHHHHHHHTQRGNRLLITVLLNLVITIAEFIGGIFSNSLALISDAFHNLSDTVAILIAYITERVSRRASDKKHTFGYKRIQILAAMFNAVTLIAISVYLIFEAWDRYQNPQPIKSLVMLSVALIGLIANLLSVLLLQSQRKENLNIKAAYLHLIGDTLSSVAVIVGGVLIYFYEWYWIDPLITVLISLYIIKETYTVLYDTYKILMQETPSGINLNELVGELTDMKEIKGIHHIHIWNLTDKEVHFEAHIDLSRDLKVSEGQRVVDKVQKYLKENFLIAHVTLQLEFDRCDDKEIIHQEGE
jgi:cobalt-zinc-cadmium efflux system protein